MKIEVNAFGMIQFLEVYAGITFKTDEGNELGVCMRDDTLELNIMPKGIVSNNWWRVDMNRGIIIKQSGLCITEDLPTPWHYHHMCRNDHVEIGHKEDTVQCPLCMAIDALHRIEERPYYTPLSPEYIARMALETLVVDVQDERLKPDTRDLEYEVLQESLQKYKDALRWCSGSKDFQEGGIAQPGWEKICAPLLKLT